DVLVVEEADQLTEADFLKLARRARRWVLIGEPAWEYAGGPRATGQASTDSRAKLALPGPFTFLRKLWNLLHWDPRALPFAWTQEGERLCCALRPVAPEQRRWLESERVADSPDIEVRILSFPRPAPALTEVLLPAGM